MGLRCEGFDCPVGARSQRTAANNNNNGRGPTIIQFPIGVGGPKDHQLFVNYTAVAHERPRGTRVKLKVRAVYLPLNG